MRSRVVVGLFTAIVLAACSNTGSNGQVDGWSIGEGGPCSPDAQQCQQMVEAATERLANRDPFHAPIVEVAVHKEGPYPNRDGEMAPLFRSGGSPDVVVFRLADGTRRAIGVKYVLGDEIPTTFDHGPQRRPGRGADGTPAPTI